MANFSKALEALGANQVSLEVISLQLRQILDDTPDYSQHLLSHLIKAKEKNFIDQPEYQHLKAIIEPYLIDGHSISISSDDNFIEFGQQNLSQEITSGTIIKQRFKLLEILGSGGMGRVYKGIDLLKQEARDKNPYVALKLLNEDFKSHPKAFISLQRESSRQQKLAHPNIATVYDFDRVGGPGTPVFITMELLEGQTLNTFIKTRLRRIGGLPFTEAFKIIKQLASALSYAHEQGIVHSDFKPGNAFICNDGTVKTLDFGIARAVKNPIEGKSERTLFDPRNLGAFTPAYASLEMLLGKAPDTRDDIYALGCVAYELLTGRHPFDKLPATKVHENKLLPKPVKGLKRKQNLTLQKALAPKREDRCQTVEEFLHSLEAKYVWYKDIKTVAALLFITLGMASFIPLNNYFEKQKLNLLSEGLNSGDNEIIEQKLIELNELDDVQQLAVTNAEKESIQNYYDRKLTELTNIEADTYNFIKAQETLDSIEILYPDSSFFLQQQEQINSNKNIILSQLYNELNLALESRDNFQQSISILNKLKSRVDPQHPLLEEEKLMNTFYNYLKKTLEENNLVAAKSILDNSLAFFPDSTQLLDMEIEINKAYLLEELTNELENLIHNAESLTDYDEYQAKIDNLSTLDPESTFIKILRYDVGILANNAILDLKKQNDRTKADSFLENYKDLLITLSLNEQLIELELLHLDEEIYNSKINQLITENSSSIDKLLSNPDTNNPAWFKQINTLLNSLSILQQKTESENKLTAYNEKIANIYVDNAVSRLSENQFNKAKDNIEIAKQYAPEQANVIETQNKIDSTLSRYQNEIEISKLKKEFNVQANANDIYQASNIIEQLKQFNLDNDYFIDTYATKKLSESYAWHGKQAAEKENYTQALEYATKGLEYYPLNQGLIDEKNKYLIETYNEELESTFRNEINFEIQNIQEKLGQIESINPNRFINIRQSGIKILTDRINLLEQSDNKQAVLLAENASVLFPGSSLSQILESIKPSPWPDYTLTKTLISDGRLTEATRLLADSTVKYKNHPDFILLSQDYANRKQQAIDEFNLFQDQYNSAGNDEKKLINAQLQLQKARSNWTDNENYLRADQNILRIINELQQSKNTPVLQPENAQFDPQEPDSNNNENSLAKNQPEAQANGQRDCEKEFAGYGRRAKAVCYDLVNDKWRGPLMVVIPTGLDINEYFAIGKYEVSVNDFGKYCYITGKCTPETDPDKQDLPISNISYKQAIDYTKWISERTGKNYRLPTLDEWQHASFAAGKQPKKDFNCRVSLGDNVMKGNGLVSIKSGNSNGWGLKNYIGNVQEWVISEDNEMLTVGGAYSDALAKCNIQLTRNHSGKADNITGFRIVLEDILE